MCKPYKITWFAAAALLFAFFLPFLQAATPNDPAHYRKASTWQETLLGSLQAVEQAGLKDAFLAFDTDIMRGSQPARHININVSGAQELYLFVTGIPDVKWAIADWADARLIKKDGTSVALSETKLFTAAYGRMEKDLTLRSGLYQKMSLGGRVFEKGLNVQANSVIEVDLGGEYEKFESWIGVDDWAGTNGTVRFAVTGAKTAAARRLWELLIRDFPEEQPRLQMAREREDRIWDEGMKSGDFQAIAQKYAKACFRTPPLMDEAKSLATTVTDTSSLMKMQVLYHRSRELDAAWNRLKNFDMEALELAIADLAKSWPGQYPQKHLVSVRALAQWQRTLDKNPPNNLGDLEKMIQVANKFETFRREALLANPLLDFEKLLVIKRKPTGEPRRSQWEDKGLGVYLGMPQQSSWAQGTMVNVDKWDNEIAVLSSVRPGGKLSTLYKSEGRKLITDVDLHWDADKMVFAMPGKSNLWQVWEIKSDGTGLRQLTPGEHPDVHNYDPCYLPNGRINFVSTAPLQGVPCNAGVIVGMMYQMDGDGKNIKQLCFEQDHNYNPTVLNNGRVLYLRWDYTDTPHVWNRILMSMNPDGTGQMEYYGANSYWPNAVFFSKAVPNHPTKIAGIVTGHHEGRVGDLVIFDPVKGRHETDGVVQRIPGRNKKVEPLIEDKLVEHNWPKFLHTWPLSEKYFLVAGKPEPDSLWGIYLVDIYDNMLLLREEEGFALLEPIPFVKKTTPPEIQNRTQTTNANALVYMENVYQGPGMKGVPKGVVKSMRIFTYHFGYQTLAGIDHRVGADGPWESKRVLGTVPVEADGSAFFEVPSRMPLSFQPLDEEGKAVALMRSWMTPMPGENVSCVGCHDNQSTTALSQRAIALTKPIQKLTPWRGPVRGFSFAREVQPVLDKYCVGCHDGKPYQGGVVLADLRNDESTYVVYKASQLDGQVMRGVSKKDLLGKYGGVFEPSYTFLRQYLRVGGLESDLHLLPPKEFHADTSELVMMLQKGHHNVKLDAEAWDRLITWIDLNAPCHGTWAETTKIPGNQCDRRLALRKLYGGILEDCEAVTEEPARQPVQPIMPEPLPKVQAARISVPGWPFDIQEAKRRQMEKHEVTRSVNLGDGIKMDLVWVPPGEFVMGDAEGALDEQPQSRVKLDTGFWMAQFEVSNEQYKKFAPAHDSRFEHRSSWIFSEEYLGWPLNQARQPVVRVTWQEAMNFCRWLSTRLGEEVTLPSEVQWEWACRAGTETPLYFGDMNADFSAYANMGDKNLRKIADEGWRPKSPDLVPKDIRFDDGALVTSVSGRYQPNAWGLQDMHGNAAEWTRSNYQPYPYRTDDGRDTISVDGKKVVRGGSWRDRPMYCRSAFRLAYPAYQKVYNVGFRVIIIETPKKIVAQGAQ